LTDNRLAAVVARVLLAETALLLVEEMEGLGLFLQLPALVFFTQAVVVARVLFIVTPLRVLVWPVVVMAVVYGQQ
jgi:hypothetical protein